MASDGETHISTRRPRPPEQSDFALEIHFKPGEANPQRIFQAADSMIRALQRLDLALCEAIDNKIQPVMVLEEIEVGSLRVWLRNVLTSTEDDALKKLDWKPAVGKYLVRAKYAYIRWSNKDEPNRTITDLSKELLSIARETDVLQIPVYSPPSVSDLAESAKDIEAAKSHLIPNEDKITYIVPDEPPVDFDLAINWAPEELTALAVKETVRAENNRLTLIVRRPDYLGTTKWDFRHGKRQISAKIEDLEWLKKFQDREIDVRPGDALRCLVTIELSYGYDNELVSESFTITKVLEVMENRLFQISLFRDDAQRRD